MLDAHKWVKSQMARRNPGGSADYTLVGINGQSLTLSDLIRSNPAQPIEVEIIASNGVRNNPRGITIPTDFSSVPSLPRTGNFTMALLPNRLDPDLVERMVAQEGLFGAVQTLTILLSQRSRMEAISPATAGLLYAHSAIPRKNPSVKTPFLGDGPKAMVDSDIRIAQYLDQQYTTGIEPIPGIIGQAKITHKYGMTKRLLDNWVDDVLAPFLAVAPANRGALRHINKNLRRIQNPKLLPAKLRKGMNLVGLKTPEDYKKAYAKLMALMPTKAEDFYHGREYGLIANPQCLYPVLTERVLPPKAILEILKVASKYPENLITTTPRGGITRVGLKLDNKAQHALIKFRATPLPYKELFFRLIRPSSSTMHASFKSKLDLIDKTKDDDERQIDLIIDAIQAPGLVDSASPKDNYFVFSDNIGGIFPSPPNKWPQQVVYAVMDTLLESLPDIVDIDNPEKNYKSKVYTMLASPKMTDKDSYLLNTEKNLSVTLGEIKGCLGSDAKNKKKRKDTIAMMHPAPDPTVKTEMEAADGGPKFLQYIVENFDRKGATTAIDAKHGKSIFELLFEAMEISKGKYNYELADSDVTFALMLLDYGIRRLFEPRDTSADKTMTQTLGGIVGRDRLGNLTKQAKDILAAQGPQDRQQTTMILHLAVLQDLVDGWVIEATEGQGKQALEELEAYATEYSRISMNKSVKEVGTSLLTHGKEQILAIGVDD